MAITVNDFTTRYPEFADVETDTPGLIQSRLDDAQSNLDQAAWATEDWYERAVYCYTAALLLDTAYGSPMGVTTDTNAKEVNRYWQLYRKQYLPLIRRRMHISGGGLP